MERIIISGIEWEKINDYVYKALNEVRVDSLALLSDSGYKNGLVACLDCDRDNTTTPIYMTFDRERHLDFSKYVKGIINNSKLKFYITHMSNEGLMYYGSIF